MKSFVMCAIAALVMMTAAANGQTVQQNFQGGSKEFATLLEAKLKYPQAAVDSCMMGSAQVDVILGDQGSLSQVSIKHSPGAVIDEAIHQFLQQTDGLWKGANGTTVSFSIAFKISYEEPAIPGEFTVTGYHFNGAQKICGSNAEHEAAFKAALKGGDFEKARVEVSTLKRRNPDSPVYEQFESLLK